MEIANRRQISYPLLHGEERLILSDVTSEKENKCMYQGRLQTTEWEKDGVKHYGFEIVARDVVFADSVSKQDGQTGTAPRSTKNEPQSMPDVFPVDDFNNAGGFDDNFGGFGNDQEWPF